MLFTQVSVVFEAFHLISIAMFLGMSMDSHVMPHCQVVRGTHYKLEHEVIELIS